jgi:PIN domain nuclease of toxin-antitoxin system
MLKKPNIRLLLDTHAFIWLVNADPSFSLRAQQHIDKIMKDEGSFAISAISLWEISMLHSRGRLLFDQPCLNWINHSLQTPGVYLTELTPEIAVDSCSLPNDFHGDPADRIIVSTARILDVPLMTRNQKILDYSHQGFVKCIEV